MLKLAKERRVGQSEITLSTEYASDSLIPCRVFLTKFQLVSRYNIIVILFITFHKTREQVSTVLLCHGKCFVQYEFLLLMTLVGDLFSANIFVRNTVFPLNMGSFS